ncbi:hypothetical protein AURDEDRAFT_115683 [Auricularia subglabra TFB-10046 SS5]|uniref:Uncharacterized protein n=1 Tax=Auricularia subglabra (strain TFB-10046 / SS5) TaxID=717982 RepID=J0LK18_AURST|nr:hypothetical protein AURDEDRAFT_115683 [Auricularia subglabra TFB-10046 SS5]
MEHTPPPAPVLSRLCIVLYYNRHTIVYSGAGILVGKVAAPWRCPMLKELAFSFTDTGPGRVGSVPMLDIGYETCDVGGSICLNDIVTFIRTAISFDSPRLRSLCLYGVSALADPDPEAAFISLQNVADDVEAFAFCSPDARELLDICDMFPQAPSRYFDSSVSNW